MNSARTIFFALACSTAIAAHAQQKPVLTPDAFNEWKDPGAPVITPDGRYFSYKMQDVMVLASTDGRFSLEKKGVSSFPCGFTSDSRTALFQVNDTLTLIDLRSRKARHITGVSMYRLDGDRLLYLAGDTLAMMQFPGGNTRVFPGVKQFYATDKGTDAILRKAGSLAWANLRTGELQELLQTGKDCRVIMNSAADHAAILAGDQLYHCRKGGPVRPVNLQLPDGLVLGGIESVSKDGSRIFLTLHDRPLPAGNPDAVKVNIWSYTDSRLQSQQKKEAGQGQAYLAVTGEDGRVIRLQQSNEYIMRLDEDHGIAVQSASDAHVSEGAWNKGCKVTQYIVSLETGERTPVPGIGENVARPSVTGRFLVYYDEARDGYYSYEVATGLTRHLTGNIGTSWARHMQPSINRGLAGWTEGDEGLLVYDTYDIWLLDPLNKEQPRNLTNGYGAKHKIIFQYPAHDDRIVADFREMPVLTAFNPRNKDNGFYALSPNGDPRKLVMGQYIFDIQRVTRGTGVHPDGFVNMLPVKARNAGIFIVKRSTPSDFPNFYLTRDFKSFQQLTHYQPEKTYNWYTTELHHWKSLTGDSLQGILYKPENFDPAKKYPLIFYYYDYRSDGLNVYWKPDYLQNASSINIPYMVSNGYLVAVVDFSYIYGEIGKSVHSSVVSAAEYFSAMPFVDRSKMGITGYSHGGYETYYLATHTNIFAAAAAGGGVTDLVAYYNGLKDDSYSAQEMSQARMGKVTLWSHPELFIKNSPIFNAHAVTSPLLMMHTSYDGAVDFRQAVEMFTALRRLGKKVWLLEYEEGNHGLWGNTVPDYSKRLMQFFDHYLKGAPAPRWMLEGRSYDRRAQEDKLELGKPGETPGEGLVSEE